MPTEHERRGDQHGRRPRAPTSAPKVPGATSSRPLRLVPGGTVSWAGSTPAVVTDGYWWLHVDGIPILSGEGPVPVLDRLRRRRALHVQVLDHHHGVGGGEVGRELVQDVPTGVGHRALAPGQLHVRPGPAS